MASVRGPDQNQALSLSGSTLTLPASSTYPIKCTIGGQQYISTANLSTTLSGLTAGTTYFVYLTLNGGSLVLLVSASTSSVLGTSNYKLVGGVIAYSATTGATIQLSDAAVNVISATLGLATGYAYTANTAIAYDTKLSDQNGITTTGSGSKINISVSGYYQATMLFNATTASGSFYIMKNGVNVSYMGTNAGANVVNSGTSPWIFCNSGDYLQFANNTSVTINSGTTVNYVSVSRA